MLCSIIFHPAQRYFYIQRRHNFLFFLSPVQIHVVLGQLAHLFVMLIQTPSSSNFPARLASLEQHQETETHFHYAGGGAGDYSVKVCHY